MSQCGDYEDIHFYVINVFYDIVIAVYFLPFKKNHPVYTYLFKANTATPNLGKWIRVPIQIFFFSEITAFPRCEQ